MSREIKFRAWNTVTEKMMLWDDIKRFGNLNKLISLNHVHVQQFTGLKEKNGVEIYEGDICRILYTDWPSNTNPEISLEDYKKSISSIGRIEYFAPEFNIVMKDRYGDFSPMSMHYGTHGEIEVIGNINQNPELL